jgi:putative transposase
MNIIQEVNSDLALNKKLNLIQLSKGSFYYKLINKNESDLANKIYELWIKHQFYGYRKITNCLNSDGYDVNHKRVLRIMRELGVQAMVPGPHTSKPGKEQIKYPYLLKNMDILKANQVWQTDITYIKLPGGFVYLVAFIDFFSRYIVGWHLGNIMDVSLVKQALGNSLEIANPEIINSDQGSQFTSHEWVNILKDKEILISMTGVGRCIDNVRIERFWRSLKYEEIYLTPPDNMTMLRRQLTDYIEFYNQKRPHQALDYKTPEMIYKMQPWVENKI